MPSDPSDRVALALWISAAIDDDSPRRPRRGWKDRVLDGASVHKLMTATPNFAVWHIRLNMPEAIVAAKVITKSPLSRNAFVRRAIAHWLITKEGVDPETIPRLARDL